VAFSSLQGWLQQEIPAASIASLDEGSDIPLTLRLLSCQINYRSAIALAWAGQRSQLAPTFAQQLVHQLQQQLHPKVAQVQVTPPAWIDITLTNHTIQQWLARAVTAVSSCQASVVDSTLSFPKYTHARCYQLLALAVEQKLITTVTQQDCYGELGAALASQPAQDLRFLQVEDWQLIYQLILIWDHLQASPPLKKTQKLAHDISDTFHHFHRHCPIFNCHLPLFPQIAILRLALVAITQGTLQQLLTLVGNHAPVKS